MRYVKLRGHSGIESAKSRFAVSLYVVMYEPYVAYLSGGDI